MRSRIRPQLGPRRRRGRRARAGAPGQGTGAASRSAQQGPPRRGQVGRVGDATRGPPPASPASASRRRASYGRRLDCPRPGAIAQRIVDGRGGPSARGPCGPVDRVPGQSQRPSRPRRHRADGRRHQRRRTPGAAATRDAGRPPGAGGARVARVLGWRAQLGPERLQELGELGLGRSAGRRRRATGDLAGLGDVLVALGAGRAGACRRPGARSGSCRPPPTWTHISRCGSDAAYGVPSARVPDHASWIARTASTGVLGVLGGAERGDRDVPAGAREPAPHVAAVAASARRRPSSPPGAGVCEQHRPDAAHEHRRVAVHPADRAGAGSNQRGPGVPWIRSRCRAPSGPATRRNSASARRSRACQVTLPRIRRPVIVGRLQSSLGISTPQHDVRRRTRGPGSEAARCARAAGRCWVTSRPRGPGRSDAGDRTVTGTPVRVWSCPPSVARPWQRPRQRDDELSAQSGSSACEDVDADRRQ